MLDQLSRFYDVHLLSLGTESEAKMFRGSFADRVGGFDYAVTQQRRAVRMARKVWRTFTSRCDFLPVLDPTLRGLCVRITSMENFDAIVLSTILLRGLPLPETCPIIGDTHNVDFDVLVRTSVLAENFLRRRYASWQARSTFREERRSGLKVDLLLTTSDRDRQIFQREIGARDVAVIPNGIDITEFSPPGRPGERGLILFTGLMSYYPNQQAMRWFLDAVFPIVRRKVPEARLVVAGAGAPDWLLAKRGNCVEVTGAVPDMRPYLERASVVIAPLLIGGGTRVKILEAQAMARPVVSTSLGAEGLEAQHGESILLADNAETFSMHIVLLLSDGDHASKMAANARTNTILHYNWDRIGERLESVLRHKTGLVPRDVCNRDGI